MRVLRPSEIAAIDEPMCPAPEVTVLMPDLKTLKTVCDRLQRISGTLVMSANWAGEMRFVDLRVSGLGLCLQAKQGQGRRGRSTCHDRVS